MTVEFWIALAFYTNWIPSVAQHVAIQALSYDSLTNGHGCKCNRGQRNVHF